MSDAENSDDERYANESFENESDNEIPEMTEFESENTEHSNDDDDDLPSVKMNTGPIKRTTFPNRSSASRNTDTVPFDSSSDEEDDVIMGQTLAEINTPSMQFQEEFVAQPALSFRPILPENNHRLKNVEEQQDISDEFSDEDDENEFQKIQDMAERYMQQNSAKTPKNENVNNENNSVENEHRYLTTDEESEEQEAETEGESEELEAETEGESEELEPEAESESEEEQGQKVLEECNNNYDDHNNQPNQNVTRMENKEFYDENNADHSNNTKTELFSRNSDNDQSLNNPSSDPANLMQIIQNSLANLKTSSDTNQNDTAMASRMLQTPVMDEATTMMSYNTDNTAILNPQLIATLLVRALKSTGFTNLLTPAEGGNKLQRDENEQVAKREEKINKNINSCRQPDQAETEEVEHKVADEEEEMEEIQNNTRELDYDDDRNVYYNSQFDYRITSQTPSSFNSDNYIFHANFIKPIHQTNSTDKLRAKPQPRISMSFSNERMREIERHNQILLRKILTQKPTYTAKNKSAQHSIQQLPSQTNLRLTTSAVNRKKQQRQIDLDNQVLKRKIAAISLRRRPLIS